MAHNLRKSLSSTNVPDPQDDRFLTNLLSKLNGDSKLMTVLFNQIKNLHSNFNKITIAKNKEIDILLNEICDLKKKFLRLEELMDYQDAYGRKDTTITFCQ